MKFDLSRASIVSLVAMTALAQACGSDDDGGSSSSGDNTTNTVTGTGTAGPVTNNVNSATSGGTTSSGGTGSTLTTSTNGTTTTTGSGGSAGEGTTGDTTTTDDTSATSDTSTSDTTSDTGTTGDTSTTGDGGGAGETGTTGEGGAAGAACNQPFEPGGGEAGGAAFEPQLVDSFDAAAAADEWAVWPGGGAVGGLLNSSVSYSSGEGLSCAGSLRVDLPFDTYAASQQAQAERDLGNPGLSWTSGTTLHLAIRFEEPVSGNLDHIAWADIFFRSGVWTFWSNDSLDLGALADFEWHDITVDLGTVTEVPDLSNVNSIGVQLGIHATAPTGGPATPPSTTFYIDDVWVE